VLADLRVTILDFRQLQYRVYEVVYESRKPDPLFSNRRYLLGLISIAVLTGILTLWVPESVAALLMAIAIYILGWTVNTPRVTFRRFLVEFIIVLAVLVPLWFAGGYILRRLFS